MAEQWEPGEYEGVPMSGESTEASTGTPLMKVRFDVGGHEVFVPFYLSEAAFERSISQLASLGFNNDFKSPVFSPKPVRLSMKHEMYNGKQKDRWELVTNKPLDESRLQQMSARAKAMSATSPPAPIGTAPKPPPAAAPAPVSTAAPGSHPKAEPKDATRDEFWRACLGANSDDSTRATVEFTSVIRGVETETGRKEGAFTPADWGNCCRQVIPF